MRNPQQTAKACLYTPEMMYIGLLHAMGEQNMLMKRPMATLSQLVVRIVQEKRRIILDKGPEDRPPAGQNVGKRRFGALYGDRGVARALLHREHLQRP
eukprot:CAMPEP_0179438402 /NCGR_PEP_ID=MMETSP0799-20121207/22146_1 /TAXON_ID=46947 /ORGANISM="Geminigera cryophila, Strain CCMP2564" /LENGTH=97 /DNA_ID=CAMNT_0021220005 /DNA_START=270 /DNA_END=560 /DNA_ORIENTATION=+